MPVFLEKGKRIGAYIVQDYIGGGGEGCIYSATTPKGDKVALKQNNLLPGDHAGRERILRHKSLLGQRHPNVAQILDVFDNADTLYVVMEFVEGQMLQKLIKTPSTFSSIQFYMLMKSCLEGLGWLHEMRIIHRDIKPENIIVVHLSPGKCEAKIVDLGVSLHTSKSRLTHRGMVGTPVKPPLFGPLLMRVSVFHV